MATDEAGPDELRDKCLRRLSDNILKRLQNAQCAWLIDDSFELSPLARLSSKLVLRWPRHGRLV